LDLIFKEFFLKDKEIKILIYSPIFTALTAFGALIRIPFFPVPVTMQTFFVLMSGIILGARGGLLSQLLYIIIGLSGVPVFSQGGGLGYIFKPTFGYIVGFPVAAYLTGILVNKKITVENLKHLKIFTTSLFAMLVIYILGMSYLAIYLIYISKVPVSVTEIFYTGFIIFVPGMILKLLLITYLSPVLMKHTRFL